MDIDAGLLLFLFVFFVLPLIQRLLGGAKQAPPQGGRPGQPRPGVPPAQPRDRARLPEASHTGTPDRSDGDDPVRAHVERAADLIPDDLWEILTGERRSRPPSQRQPAPVPETEIETQPEREAESAWASDAEEVWQREQPATQFPDLAEEQPYQQPRPLDDTPWPREPEELARTTPATRAPTPPVVTQSVPVPATARPSHYLTPDAAASRPSHAQPHTSAAGRRRMPPSLSSRSELKRAFVLREVLGPPKALE